MNVLKPLGGGIDGKVYQVADQFKIRYALEVPQPGTTERTASIPPKNGDTTPLIYLWVWRLDSYEKPSFLLMIL